MAILGVDVGGTHVRIGRLCGEDTERTLTLPSAGLFPRGKGAAGLIAAIRDYLGGDTVEAVGVGIPGTLSRDGEQVLNVPNLPALNGLALRAELSAALKTRVFVENDVTMLLTGDARRLGLTRGVIFGCYIGTGLGGAVLADGVLLRGHNGLCEPGHLPLYGLDRRCECGKTGCAEAYLGGRALERLRAERYPGCEIGELFTALSGAEREEYASRLAYVLAAAVQLLDPEAVVMGGGVCAMKAFPRELVQEKLAALCMQPVPAGTLHLLYPAPRADAGVYGAAVFARLALA